MATVVKGSTVVSTIRHLKTRQTEGGKRNSSYGCFILRVIATNYYEISFSVINTLISRSMIARRAIFIVHWDFAGLTHSDQ